MNQFFNVHIVRKLNAPDAARVIGIAKIIEKFCESNGVDIVDTPKNSTTLVIAIGGDGTMIFAAKEAAKVNGAVIGFNTGNRGFLTEFHADVTQAIHETISDAFSGKLRVERRALITGVASDGSEFTALNEIVLSNLYSDVIIDYEIIVNGFSAGRHKSNSLIIATPTGSTAYALSVGGGIADPALDIIQIIPVAALALTSNMRPLIMSSSSEVLIKVHVCKGNTISIKTDGRPSVEYTAESIDEEFCFRLVRAGQKVRFLHHPDWNFFEVLTEKLHWARN